MKFSVESFQYEVISINYKHFSDLQVPSKFRYPFYGEMLWYVLERYISCMMNKGHRVKSKEELDEEKELKSLSSIKSRNISPDIDEKSNDSTTSRESNQSSRRENDASDFSAPQSPIEDEHNYGFNPRSPKMNRSAAGSPAPGSTSTKSKSVKNQDDINKTLKLSAQGDYVDKFDLIKPLSVKLEDCMKENNAKPWQHLTSHELVGLESLRNFLETTPAMRKVIPKDIPDPEGMLKDFKVGFIFQSYFLKYYEIFF